MVLDGDEIWTKRAMEEASGVINNNPEIECVVAPFYLCVGDIFHRTFRHGAMEMLGLKDFFYPRFIKIINGVHWRGDYNMDTLITDGGKVFCMNNNSFILHSKYWHVTHLKRSSQDDNDYSSGGSRKIKRRLTYFIVGRKINEPVPEVFQIKNDFKMSVTTSFVNFVKLIFNKL